MDLSTITDLNQLNELYVQCNESLIQAQRTVQVETNNIANIRSRITQIRQQNQLNEQAFMPPETELSVNSEPQEATPSPKPSRRKSK